MKKYFYTDGQEQFGPYNLDELLKHITPKTKVWSEGMTDWLDASEVEEIAASFSNNSDVPPEIPEVEVETIEYKQTIETPIHPPKTWLVESILCTICCCTPLGIVGIVYASKVDSHFYSKRYEEADRCSKLAKNWVTAAFFSGFGIYVIYMLITILEIVGPSL